MCTLFIYIYVYVIQKCTFIKKKRVLYMMESCILCHYILIAPLKKLKTRPEEGAASTAPLAPHLGDLISDAAEVEVQLALRKASNQDLG